MCRRIFTPMVLVILLAGCNSYNLRYRAMPQPSGANLFADYTQLQDAIGVSIDTDGRRLEDIFIARADGTQVHPTSITYAGMEPAGGIGTGVGAAGDHTAVGGGLFFPVGERTSGLTAATFSAAAIGPAPWTLHVKVQGVAEGVFPGFGGPPNAK